MQEEATPSLKSLKRISVAAGIMGHPLDTNKVRHDFSITEEVDSSLMICKQKKIRS